MRVTEYNFESEMGDLDEYVGGMKALMGKAVTEEVAVKLEEVLRKEGEEKGSVKFPWTALIVTAVKA